MIHPLDLAAIAAYGAFAMSSEDRLGEMPPWSSLPPEARADWRAVADAAQMAAAEPWHTGLSLNGNCEPWPVPADSRLEGFHEDSVLKVTADHATLRRIGWLDQKGRVWLAVPPSVTFGAGSLTPLLIDAGERTANG